MTASDIFTESLFIVRTLNYLFVPAHHPLRAIRKKSNEALDKLEPMFTQVYAAKSERI